jgi:outer membrane PBP1 activator LpoA protein
MNNYITQMTKWVCLTAILLTMVACGSADKRVPSEFATSANNVDSILKSAANAEPNVKNPLLVQAAGILLEENRIDKALELLIRIDSRYLDSNQKDTFHLFYGESLLNKASLEVEDKRIEHNEASLAQLLSIASANSHSIEWQIRYFQSLSDSYFATHNYLEAAKQRIGLDDLIDDAEVLAVNNQKIWDAIAQMSPEFLQHVISDFNTQRLNGWLEIVRINQKWGQQPDRLLAQMALWKKRFPLHPAMVVQPKSLQRLTSIEPINPKKIAVLLPLTGRFAKQGKMVHDGIIAAHYQKPGVNEIPLITFYDTAESYSGLTSYQKAINEGAEFVIGPLNKKAIDEIMQQEELLVPSLFLNTSNSQTSHEGAYQFVLSIEDEAIQAAHRAWENGYRKAIAFVSSDSRGERANKAFKDYFEQLGGEVIDSQQYGDIKDLDQKVKQLLRVDSSINRKNKLERMLGRNIVYEMRRRQDADFIFMLSKPIEARRIKPFIDFYFALDLPVIATSRIYSGRPAPQLDNELDGIEFSDIPLYISQQAEIMQTRESINQIDPEILKDSSGRLFSLGYDAYQIISQISRLQAFPDYRWYGLSGEIGIDESGFVHRYLTWAKFQKGLPKATKERLPPVFESEDTPKASPMGLRPNGALDNQPRQGK